MSENYWALVVGAVAGAAVAVGLFFWMMLWMAWHGRHLAPWDSEPVECAYCGRLLGSVMLRAGIEENGVAYCDSVCHVRALSRALNELVRGRGGHGRG